MLPDPPAWPPEIDILEILCQEPDKIYLSNHWPNPRDPKGNSLSQTGEFKGVDFSDGFHTVAVEWDPGEIRWFIDGVQRHRSDQSVPDVPMFLLVNLAVGGWAEHPTRRRCSQPSSRSITSGPGNGRALERSLGHRVIRRPPPKRLRGGLVAVGTWPRLPHNQRGVVNYDKKS